MARFARVFQDLQAPVHNINGAEKRILSAREHKQFIIARLEGVEDINAAMALKGKTVEILRADAHMKDGEFFVQDILGFTVVDEDGHTVGKLVDAFETPASMLYVVRGESEHLIPAVREFILGIDAESEQIRVHLIEGM